MDLRGALLGHLPAGCEILLLQRQEQRRPPAASPSPDCSSWPPSGCRHDRPSWPSMPGAAGWGGVSASRHRWPAHPSPRCGERAPLPGGVLPARPRWRGGRCRGRWLSVFSTRRGESNPVAVVERHEVQFSHAARCVEACAGHPGHVLQDIRHPANSECGCATNATQSIEGGQHASRSSQERHRQFPAGKRIVCSRTRFPCAQ